MEDAYIMDKNPSVDKDHIWTLIGSDDFSTMTLTPSLDAGPRHWHGFITNGEIVGGL